MSMRQDVSNRLDAVDKLEPGEGSFNAFMFGAGGLDSGALGFGLDYGHRINTNWSAFAAAEAGYYYGDESGLGYEFKGGIRGTF